MWARAGLRAGGWAELVAHSGGGFVHVLHRCAAKLQARWQALVSTLLFFAFQTCT